MSKDMVWVEVYRTYAHPYVAYEVAKSDEYAIQIPSKLFRRYLRAEEEFSKVNEKLEKWADRD